MSEPINGPLGGRCLDLTAGQFTRDDLLRIGLTPEAADELMAFAARLMLKAKRRAPTQENER